MGQIPIDVDDFKAIRDDGSHYIGKSMLIGRILEKSRRGVSLFTRPCRFGKSLNPSMLDAFFDLDHKGNTWFDGLEISEHPECEQYRNRFPAIRMDLKDIGAESFDGFLSDFKGMLARAFRKALRAPGSDGPEDVDRGMFESILARKGDAFETKDALRFLSEALELHCGEKAVVLIDEYDAPVTRASDEVRR